MEKLITLPEVANILSVHPNTVRRLVAAGRLKAVRISERGDLRFRLTDLEAYLAERQTPASA